jgi:hypothetical protein
MADAELQFRGAIDREDETRIVTDEKFKSIQKFALVIITWFSMAPQRRPFDAVAELGHGQSAARESEPSWQINYTNAFWESENHHNLLFF